MCNHTYKEIEADQWNFGIFSISCTCCIVEHTTYESEYKIEGKIFFLICVVRYNLITKGSKIGVIIQKNIVQSTGALSVCVCVEYIIYVSEMNG